MTNEFDLYIYSEILSSYIVCYWVLLMKCFQVGPMYELLSIFIFSLRIIFIIVEAKIDIYYFHNFNMIISILINYRM